MKGQWRHSRVVEPTAWELRPYLIITAFPDAHPTDDKRAAPRFRIHKLKLKAESGLGGKGSETMRLFQHFFGNQATDGTSNIEAVKECLSLQCQMNEAKMDVKKSCKNEEPLQLEETASNVTTPGTCNQMARLVLQAPAENKDERFSIFTCKLEGYEHLNEDDKKYTSRHIHKGAHLYLRYDFINQKVEVLRHSHIIGWLPSSIVEDMHKLLAEDKIGAATVLSKTNKQITTALYISDESGSETLPYYPFEGRRLSIYQAEYWRGDDDWSENWAMDVYTDELIYLFRELYTSDEEFKEFGSSVGIQIMLFCKDFRAGRFTTRKQIEEYCEIIKGFFLQSESAEKAFKRGVESYLVNKGYALLGEDEFPLCDCLLPHRTWKK